MTSNGTADGFFQGTLDEARIWNVVRSQSDLQADMFHDVTNGTGLIGRWALDEGTGTTTANSIAGSPVGTLTSGPQWVSGTPYALSSALKFGSSNAYASFLSSSTLNSPTFTIETWFRRDGAGTTVSTGTGGITAIPLIAKGTSEAETANADINYFLGIRNSDNVICADFEEAQTGSSPPA